MLNRSAVRSTNIEDEITNIDLQYKTVRSYKTVVVGSSNIGKTSIINRLTKDEFRNDTLSTVGAAFTTQTYETSKGTIRLDLWDTAGQERFNSLVPMYYRESQVVLCIYDITDETSLNEAKMWVVKIKDELPTATIILVGNKTDLLGIDNYNYCNEDGHIFSINESIPYFEVSAKSGEGINEIFESAVIERLKLDNVYKEDELYHSLNIGSINSTNENTNRSGCFSKFGDVLKSLF